ncbi:MAG: hypothetical protein ACK5X3_23305 [Pseudomonadota bacterium]
MTRLAAGTDGLAESLENEGLSLVKTRQGLHACVVCHSCQKKDYTKATGPRPTHEMGRYLAQRLVNNGMWFQSKKWKTGAQYECRECHGDCLIRNPQKKEIQPIQQKEEAMTPAHVKPVNPPRLSVVEPPRKPTIDDRRLVRMKLDDVYLPDEGMYSGDLSDLKIAKDLNVPVAWVSEVRELYGDDRCKDQPLTRDELAKAFADVKRAEREITDAKEKITKIEADMKPTFDLVKKAYASILKA